MNNKGQVIFLTMMIGIVIIVLALAFAPGLKKQIDITRGATGLDCSNNSISTFNQATCIVTDLNMFYFVGGLIFIAGAVLMGRKLLS